MFIFFLNKKYKKAYPKGNIDIPGMLEDILSSQFVQGVLEFTVHFSDHILS